MCGRVLLLFSLMLLVFSNISEDFEAWEGKMENLLEIPSDCFYEKKHLSKVENAYTFAIQKMFYLGEKPNTPFYIGGYYTDGTKNYNCSGASELESRQIIPETDQIHNFEFKIDEIAKIPPYTSVNFGIVSKNTRDDQSSNFQKVQFKISLLEDEDEDEDEPFQTFAIEYFSPYGNSTKTEMLPDEGNQSEFKQSTFTISCNSMTNTISFSAKIDFFSYQKVFTITNSAKALNGSFSSFFAVDVQQETEVQNFPNSTFDLFWQNNVVENMDIFSVSGFSYSNSTANNPSENGGLSNFARLVIALLLFTGLCICPLLCCILCIVGISRVCCILTKKNKPKDDVKPLTANDVMDQIEMNDKNKKTANLQIDKSLFKINMQEIKVISKIGSGGFATVFLGEYQNMKVAFKTFNTELLASTSDGDTDTFENFESELKLISSLNHRNIPRFYGASLESPRCGLVMEYCPNGDLKDYLTKNKISIEERVNIIHGIVQGMEFLASKNIIHRDLKPENVLISEYKEPKITDFGLSRSNNSDNKTVKIGTNLYMSPEVFKGEDYGLASDVFSFGIMCYNILSLNFNPFGRNTSQFQSKMACNADFRPDVDVIDAEITKNYSWLIAIMETCWSEDPSQRLSFKQINEQFNKHKNKTQQ